MQEGLRSGWSSLVLSSLASPLSVIPLPLKKIFPFVLSRYFMAVRRGQRMQSSLCERGRTYVLYFSRSLLLVLSRQSQLWHLLSTCLCKLRVHLVGKGFFGCPVAVTYG